MREIQTKRRHWADARGPSDESGLGAVRDLKLARISEIGDQAMVASAQALAPLMLAHAEALAKRVHGAVEPGGSLVWETVPGNPFAVFGGISA